ncbi:unnamed protein product [Heligmosomoides polygyrus]|uniref:Uncharacterized protein n=1 Tax=Heligmosomoides polygyrus TaxID=6339 RepID=A0A183GNE0_HELPZ|nr:unnamed protein product [Heligmosomoides polygyrus]
MEHYLTTIEMLPLSSTNTSLGRRGSIEEYPHRSPDLTPRDFFLWGYWKDKAYQRKPKTIEEVKNAIKEE